VHFDGVDTRNDAETLTGSTLYLHREDLEAPDEGEHYIIDLIGLKVLDDEGNELGELKEIFQHGAADVYAVKGERSFMFPALKHVIQSVDLETGEIRVNAAALSEVIVYDDV
jgi:16S rRNA processing protein RimM